MSDGKTVGGKAARYSEGPLWTYTEKHDGSFVSPDAEYVSRLYFPVLNRYGMKCSVTPELKGDICSSFHTYHSVPKVTEDFHRSNDSRNFWVYVEDKQPWSATGVSAAAKAKKWQDDADDTCVTGQIGSFTIERKNKTLGLKSTATTFVPHVKEFVELTLFTIENTSSFPVTFTPTMANPIYGRTPDNLRDHRVVTSMFIEGTSHPYGVSIRPKINFNEHGHSDNDTRYAVFGYGEDGEQPQHIWRTVRDFAGEGGSLDNPVAVCKNLDGPEVEPRQYDGFEAVGAMKFAEVTLAPGDSKTWIMLNGITEDPADFDSWHSRYGSMAAAQRLLEDTCAYWQEIVNEVSFDSDNIQFDNWAKWINFQLICRQVYGNSYLPDFGYGRGGRGWRDLFSDLLAIFLIDPQSASDEIQNEFLGIRVDGTNATIVGTKPGEFIADRNQVPRTWSEHGTWPFFVLNFYMEQTGDYDVLFKDFTYWKDAFVFRSKKRDDAWSTEEYGNKQKTADGSVYRGTILEHTLIQQLSSFFHVGTHNNILLEGADWNDTYDMARDRGESVCFFNWYAHNLKTIADVLTFLKQTKGITTIKLLKEMTVLLDSMPGQTKIPYDSPEAKRNHLFAYYDRVKHVVSGERVDVPVDDLIADLRGKADAVYEHIRTNELITTKDGDIFYNGHYDNDENRVHGEHPAGIRIDLTSQVLPTMFGTATDEQIPQIFASVKKYLRDPDTGGLRLCSEFKEDRMYFGRLTGFVFGHKEHGGKWMQQNVMYILGLYRRGFVNEAYEIFTDVFTMCHNSKISKIFPGIPSYFEMDGRGAYHYLTGSATWLMIAIVTQMYGIRGRRGDFVINPKLKVEQFGNSGQCTIQCNFRNRRMRVTYRNPQAVEWDSYAVKSVTVNGNKVSFNIDGPRATLSAESFDSVFTKEHNEVWVALG